MSSVPANTSTSQSLSFISLNSAQPTTILLIHGLQFTGQHQWELVAPLLSTYHLLIPDLPGRGSSAHIKPYTIPHATALLAALIRSHAHNGVALVVGLSLGGYIGRHLSKTHPELVESLFASGCAGTPSGWKGFVAARPQLFAALNSPLGVVPRPVVRAALVWGLGSSRRPGLCLRDGSGTCCRAFVVREAIHAWNMQLERRFCGRRQGLGGWKGYAGKV